MKARLGLQRFVCFGVAMMAPFLAYAYQLNTCSAGTVKWSNTNPTIWKMHTGSFTAGSAMDQVVQRAMQAWTNVAGSKFVFNIGRDSSAISNTDYINQVYIANYASSPGYLAVTRMRWVCGGFIGAVMNEADVEFANAPNAQVPNRIQWTTSTGFSNDIVSNQNLGVFSIEGVALHEFGHALGLEHENRWVSTMNSYYPFAGPVGGDTRRWLPHGDDRVGARVLYPDATTETDVTMVGFKANPAVAGASIPVAATPSVVYRGSQVTMDFVFNNMGTSRATVNNGFYLSTDRNITYSDPWIAYVVGAWSNPGTTWGPINLTIPTWITPGNYYLGAIIDYDNLIAERYDGASENSQNAATLLTIR